MPGRSSKQRGGLDAVQLRLYAQLLDSVCEDMGTVLQRAAFSPNIKERKDFSTALFDGHGRLAAQGHNIPVHLGSMFASVQAVLQHCERRRQPLEPGDLLMLNDPYSGGTHLPDISLIAPYFGPGGREPLFILCNRAHHADIGGATGGGLGLSRELFEEGLIIPPVYLKRGDVLQQDILDILLTNNRSPQERRGDIAAQLGSLQRGQERLAEMLAADASIPAEKLAGHWRRIVDDLCTSTGDSVQELIATLPDGSPEFSAALEVPGPDAPVLRLRIEKSGDRLLFDFRASSPQHEGPFNAVRAITLSAVFYCLRCLLPPEVPTNQGLLRGVEILTTPGTIVDARPPAAVAAGNVETSQRLVDLVLGALRGFLPERIPAQSQGTMNNVVFSGQDNRPGRHTTPFTYYETLAGGHGASQAGPGLSARHSHMTNTLNTPVEALEHAYPLRVWRYALRSGSGGTGLHPGGEGLIREYELLEAVQATVLSQRRAAGPDGAQGGGNGGPGRNSLQAGRKRSALPSAGSFRAAAGSRVTVETPGGGGWGKPRRKPSGPGR